MWYVGRKLELRGYVRREASEATACGSSPSFHWITA